MLRNLAGVIVISVGIAGCATKPVAVSDNTLQHPTAVIEQQIVSNGIKGFLPFETNDRHFVRTNMRRDEATFKGTGTFTGFLVGTQSDTVITRLDRKLKWLLNTEKEEYTECPLTGCTKPSGPSPAKREQAEKPPQAKNEPGCTMHIAHTSFTVKATGLKKSVNGFETEEYQAAWVVQLRDNSARNTTSTLNLDIWTTPMTGSVRDVLAMEENYARALNGSDAQAGKPQMIPADAAKLISAFLASSLKSSDLKAFLEAGRQMEKIKGFPISTHLAWNMEGEACAPKETKEAKEKSAPIPANAGDLVSGLAGLFVQKKTEDTMKESASEPILSFTFEVKKLAIELVHDDEFTVPGNYSLVSQP
jgi:hypothetical protein